MNQSRYPGAKPFETHQQNIFFGRHEDTAKLFELIHLEPLVVLYSKSGMGKSSVLNAGIIPAVKKQGEYEPIQVRFKAWTEDKKETPDLITRQTMTLNGSATSFLDTLIEDEPSLLHDLKERQIERKKKVLLIFDQFEELFTYPKEAIQAFKEDLAEALHTKIPQRYRSILEKQIEDNTFKLTNEEYQILQEPIELRIVIAIRSDRMSFLNGLTDALHTILKNLFELPPLSIEAAERAILEPAHNKSVGFSSPSFDFEPSAIQKIIDFLTQNKTERIESTQLQIICQSVESKVKSAGQIIRESELGDLNLVIENYYYDQLKQLGDDEVQLPARRFIEEGLIFEEEERRLSIYEGQIFKAYQITPEMLKVLVDAHLLRAEPSMQGGYTYELSHDTLVKPILKAKNKRLEEEKREAERLEAEQRRETERLAAEQRREKERLAVIEREHERQIKEAQKQKELDEAKELAAIESSRRQRATLLSIASVIGFILAAIIGIWAYQQKNIAEKTVAAYKIEEQKRKEAESMNVQVKMEALKTKIHGFIKGEAFDLAKDSLQVLERMNPADADIPDLKKRLVTIKK